LPFSLVWQNVKETSTKTITGSTHAFSKAEKVIYAEDKLIYI